MSTKTAELAIVGAGPAGISAAIVAAGYGIHSVILDEQPRPGGRLLCQIHRNPKKPGEWWNGPGIAAEMLRQAQAANVEILSQTEVWGVFPSWSVMLSGPGRGSIESIEAKAVLVASGGGENGLPFPGWARPGVISVGAAQTMMMQHRLLPGQRVLVVGTDPLAVSVAMDMSENGAKVAGVVLPPPGPACGPMAKPREAFRNLTSLSKLSDNPALRTLGSLFGQAASLGIQLFPTKGLTVEHVPFMLRRCVIGTAGTNAVESATLADLNANGRLVEGSEQEIELDAVCISGGLYPLAELAEACGCKFAYIEELGGRVPLYSADMQTTQRGLFVAGSATGIEGAQVAMAQGKMAAIGIAGHLGRVPQAEIALLLEQAAASIEMARQDALLSFNPHVLQGRSKQAQLWNDFQSATETAGYGGSRYSGTLARNVSSGSKESLQ